jgi:N6-L-threonylcarbamoyladenine synthase
MLVLGIETSCDETGVALYDTAVGKNGGLLAHALHSQVAMHAQYGGVVPELASRDHIRHGVPLIEQVCGEAGVTMQDIDGIAYTQGPGLAGALLVGAGLAKSLAFALNVPAIGVHHLEGHLLSPLLSSDPPTFPHIALLVSGGHTQLMDVAAVGNYTLLGETIDDAAGEAFDKSAKLLGLPYPGGPKLAKLAERGRAGQFKLPRPLLRSGDLNFSFAGLKTAVLTQANKCAASPDDVWRADLAREFEQAVADVLVAKSLAALQATGRDCLVVAGGVGANQRLRAALKHAARTQGFALHFPELEFCSDNGAMIALAGALRLQMGLHDAAAGFSVKPRWALRSEPETADVGKL